MAEMEDERKQQEVAGVQVPAQAEPAPEERGEGAPEERGEAAPEERGEAAPEERGEAAPEERGEAAPEERGEVAPEERGEAAPEERGEVAPEERGVAAREQRGEAAPEERGEVAGQGAAEPAPEAGQEAAAQQSPAAPPGPDAGEGPEAAPGSGSAPGGGAEEPAEMPAIPEIRPGQSVEGTVVQVEADHLLVDVGYKSDGTVPLSEVRLHPDQGLADAFTVGQRIPVTVMEVDGQDGGLVLSQRRAVEARAWKHLEDAHRAGEVITAPVTEHVKGGLVVDVGLRGFMPASQVERGYVNDLSVYVGHPIRAKVIEIDRGKNRVILSQKAVLEDEHQRMRDKTWADLTEGQVRRGVVKGLTDFGAFVDLGGVDGLLHVSEMAWGRVDHPSDVLNVGDEINVKILRLDREKEKISLGLKQVLPDPWETAEQRYAVSSIVDGKVMRLAPFGAFVQLEPGVEGLVHISQLADYHVNEPGEVVREGQAVRVKILRVSPEERRISLSLRDAERQRERGGGFPHHGNPLSPRNEPVTLGDMFGRLFDQARERLEDDTDR